MLPNGHASARPVAVGPVTMYSAAQALASLRHCKLSPGSVDRRASPPGGESQVVVMNTRKRRRVDVSASATSSKQPSTETQGSGKKSFTSAYYGVSFHKSSGRWAVQIRTGVSLVALGRS